MRCMNSTDLGTVAVCGVFCYKQNKLSYVPADTLKEVVMKGFSEEDISRGKDMAFEAPSSLSTLKDVRKKNQNKKKVEADVHDTGWK